MMRYEYSEEDWARLCGLPHTRKHVLPGETPLSTPTAKAPAAIRCGTFKTDEGASTTCPFEEAHSR